MNKKIDNNKYCKWKLLKEDRWETGCGDFVSNTNVIQHGGLNYCGLCGGIFSIIYEVTIKTKQNVDELRRTQTNLTKSVNKVRKEKGKKVKLK